MRLQLFGGFLAAAVLGMMGCQSEDPTIEEVTSSQIGGGVLNTYGPDYIQIDKLDEVYGVGGDPADANLFVGDDPADGTASVDFPAGPGPFIDWEDLAVSDPANHFLIEDATLAKDPSSFPRANECVGPSSVLSKMDLLYAGAYNNIDHAYFVVSRSDNSGDAGYYWLFTKVEPSAPLGEAPCRPTEHRLMYTISEGDVLFAGHFKPSASIPLLRVFRANADSPGLLTAVEAINFESGLWDDSGGSIDAVAVNTTMTQPGTLGYAGVKKLLSGDDGTAIGQELIAELAVHTALFTGGVPCGATFYGSVISRSSGSGGTTPDLKDLIGPALYRFGDIKAEVELTPSCEEEFSYVGSGTGLDDQPLVDPICEWAIDGGAFAEGSCAGTLPATPGSHEVTLRLTDQVSGCEKTTEPESIVVYEELGATADLEATCELSFSYTGGVTGGAGDFAYEWVFEGAGAVTPATSSALSGVATVSLGATEYEGDFFVINERPDGLVCRASADDVATPYAPLTISLEPVAAAQTCPSMSSDAATYQAIVSGGDGAYSFAWFGPEGCLGDSCTINPEDADFCVGPLDFYARVDDGSPLCDAKDSETETYAKVTTITITNR